MKIVVLKQDQSVEARVPMVPALAKRLIGGKVDMLLEKGVGLTAGHSDKDYEEVGAKMFSAEQAPLVMQEADIVVTLHPPSADAIGGMQFGTIVVGMLAPLKQRDTIQQMAKQGITAFSMEFIPRISRAQAMDVLSSQASIGGYKAVILAAEACPKMFPMMITAAGTIAPARVFVLGAGVAGLQAIATAKRLGAVVEAYDVRAVVKEQVQSLGARFVELPTAAQEDKATGGYAREQTDAERQQQAALMAKHVTGADVVITTAALFGKAPPLLIPADVVSQMKAGSVIVDLAADVEAGRGNCEATVPDETIATPNGVTIIGETNLPGLVPVHASQVYAANMVAFLKNLIDTAGNVSLKLEDEIQKAALITHDNKITNDMVRSAVGAGAA